MVFRVSLLQKPIDIRKGVSVDHLEASGRVGHCEDSLGDVGDVEIVRSFPEPISFAAHLLPNPIHLCLQEFNK